MLKCGDKHYTKDYKLPAKSTPRCTNYKGSHTANYIRCLTYQVKLNAAHENKTFTVERMKTVTAEQAGTNLGNSNNATLSYTSVVNVID